MFKMLIRLMVLLHRSRALNTSLDPSYSEHGLLEKIELALRSEPGQDQISYADGPYLESMAFEQICELVSELSTKFSGAARFQLRNALGMQSVERRLAIAEAAELYYRSEQSQDVREADSLRLAAIETELFAMGYNRAAVRCLLRHHADWAVLRAAHWFAEVLWPYRAKHSVKFFNSRISLKHNLFALLSAEALPAELSYEEAERRYTRLVEKLGIIGVKLLPYREIPGKRSKAEMIQMALAVFRAVRELLDPRPKEEDCGNAA